MNRMEKFLFFRIVCCRIATVSLNAIFEHFSLLYAALPSYDAHLFSKSLLEYSDIIIKY